jgi:hypothetical protein
MMLSPATKQQQQGKILEAAATDQQQLQHQCMPAVQPYIWQAQSTE